MTIEEIMNVPVFKGLTYEEMKTTLELLQVKEKVFNADSVIINSDSITRSFGILLEGSATIQTYDRNGNRYIIYDIKPGELFSETFAILNIQPKLLEVRSQTKCRVIGFSLDDILKHRDVPWMDKIRVNLIYITAAKNLMLAKRVFFSSQRRLRDKIIMYLSSELEDHKSTKFYISMNRQELADYLAVDRSALSYELSKMQSDGLIKYKKNYFEIYF